MPNMDTVTIAGHLGHDAIIKDTRAGHVTELRVAVNYGRKDHRKTTWYTVECWHEVAKGCQHLRKGEAVVCVGHMREDRWGTDGQKHSKWKLTANIVGKALYVKDEPKQGSEPDYHEEADDDSEIPF